MSEHCCSPAPDVPVRTKTVVPLYNRFMAFLAERLYHLARRADGASLRYGPLYKRGAFIFERPTQAERVYGPTDDERLASLRQYLYSHRDDREFMSALSRGVEKGRSVFIADKDSKARARALAEYEKMVERFKVQHDPDDSLEF